jgi:predicted amino acid racemase
MLAPHRVEAQGARATPAVDSIPGRGHEGRGIAVQTPRLEIDLRSIGHNARFLTQFYARKGIRVTGVTKGVCGDPMLARTFLANGIRSLADARLENLGRLREAGIQAPLMLLRIPALSQVAEVVRLADYSLNSELEVLGALSDAARRIGRKHGVILMVELGDLREGIMPQDLPAIVRATLAMDGLRLSGIGANLFCFGGVRPDEKNMRVLSRLAERVEREFDVKLEFVSGGATSNYQWASTAADLGRIDHLRCGEALLVGGVTLPMGGIPGMRHDAFKLVAEVVEAKRKPSKPWGESLGTDAFGIEQSFVDRGERRRLIANVGRQDIFAPQDLRPLQDIQVLGASSDHLVIDAAAEVIQVGDEISFYLGYNSTLFAMSSSYVHKVYLHEEEGAGE